MTMAFFVVCPIGFEPDVVNEIVEWQSLWGNESSKGSINIRKGGVEYSGSINFLHFNRYTRLSTRILWRRDEFKCYHFSDFEKKMKISKALENLPKEEPILVRIEAQKSKLGNEKRLFETLQNTWKERKIFSKPSDLPESALSVYINGYEDVFTVSLDSSGSPLYKRSMNKWSVPGSMRENIAHWGFVQLLKKYSPRMVPTVLIDPFAGGGTLLSESTFNRTLCYRPMSYEKWIGIDGLKKNDLKISLGNYNFFVNKIGYEIDEKNFETLKHNVNENEYSIIHGDCFNPSNGDSLKKENSKIWIYTNAPYGRQVSALKIKDYVLSLKKRFDPALIAIYHPEKAVDSSAKEICYWSVSNGGLSIFLSVLYYG